MVLATPLGFVIRHVRKDMPRVVARDYGGATAAALVTVMLLAIGLAHRHVVIGDQRALQDATARAEAFIGAHAPAAFQRDLSEAYALPIQPPHVYRVCVPAGNSDYCVVVDRDRPFGQSVRFAGHEPNQLLAMGAE